MTADDIEALWADRRHWHLAGNVYRCDEDPRVIVPKRRGELGWTLNFARPTAIPLLLGVLTAFLLPVLLAIWSRLPFAWVAVLGLMLVEVPLLFWLCLRLGSAERAATRLRRRPPSPQ